jgi:hypothetical protein
VGWTDGKPVPLTRLILDGAPFNELGSSSSRSPARIPEDGARGLDAKAISCSLGASDFRAVAARAVGDDRELYVPGQACKINGHIDDRNVSWSWSAQFLANPVYGDMDYEMLHEYGLRRREVPMLLHTRGIPG